MGKNQGILEKKKEMNQNSPQNQVPQGIYCMISNWPRFLANMNDFIQPESPLNLNIGATQSAENSGHDRIISENISCEAETRAEATQEEVN